MTDPIEYLLNAMEHAAQSNDPFANNYGAKRRAVLDAIKQLRAELADAARARDSAYERAASLCEGIGVWKECAAAIRALSCVVVKDSARTCQRGTKGCERNHL